MVNMKPVSQVSPEDSVKVYSGSIGASYTPTPLKTKQIQVPFQEVARTYTHDKVFPHVGILSNEQRKALLDISHCKTPKGGFSVYQCSECGNLTYNYNKCKNRNCPVCQNLKTLIWLDDRRSEVIDSDYYHLVMTLPHELNPVIYENQKLLYGLLHKSVSSAIIQYAKDDKHLGGEPGIVQVLHTWDQLMGYHVHVHVIVTGAVLTKDGKIVQNKNDGFFCPEKVLSKLVKGKYMDALKKMYKNGELKLAGLADKYKNRYEWNELIEKLYSIDWISYIKETFNGNGNAMEYLARYTNKVAIGDSRIKSVASGTVIFTSRDSEGKQTIENKVSYEEFVGRYLMHVLPSGFQKIRYYGFLANNCRKKKLEGIFKEQGKKQSSKKYKEPTEKEVLRVEFKIDLDTCPKCGKKGTMLEVDLVKGTLNHTYTPSRRKRMQWAKNYSKYKGS